MSDELEKMLIDGNIKFQAKIMGGMESVSVTQKGPKYPILILTCMDARIDVHRIFQLKVGDVIVLRNAGNVYSKDVIRSILIAIHEFGVKKIVVLGHIDCGMAKVNLNDLKKKLSTPFLQHISEKSSNEFTQLRKFFKLFSDEFKNVEDQVNFLMQFPDIPSGVNICGMFYDVNSGWVFEPEIVKSFTLMDSFSKNYKDLLYLKKEKLKEYLSSRKSVSEEELEPARIESEAIEFYSEDAIEEAEINEVKGELKPSDLYKSVYDKTFSQVNRVMPGAKRSAKEGDNRLLSVRKVHIPKIHLPKISVNVPKTYFRKREPDVEDEKQSP